MAPKPLSRMIQRSARWDSGLISPANVAILWVWQIDRKFLGKQDERVLVVSIHVLHDFAH